MRRALRIAAWSLGSLVLLGALGITAVLVAGNTAAGRQLIEQKTAALTGGRVRLSGLSGAFPSAIDLARLQLSDDDGVWLTAERATLRWSPLALLTWHADVELVSVERLGIERRPASRPAPGKRERLRLPRIDIGQLHIETLELGEPLAGTRASLSVQGSAHLVSLEDAKTSLVAHTTDGSGTYEVTLSFDPARMDATVKLEEPAGGPLANLLKHPGLGALSVAGTLKGPRGAERVQLIAHAGELDAQVNGVVDLTRESANLAYSVESPAMSPRAGLSWQRVFLQGHWLGTLRAPRAQGQLQIVGLQVPGGAQLATLDAHLNGDRGELALDATAQGVVVPGPKPRFLSDSPLRLNAKVRLNEASRPLQLLADHRLFSLQASATTAGARQGTFNLRLPDLAAFTALVGRSVPGKAQLNGKVEQRSSAIRLDLEGTAELPPDTVNALSRTLEGTSRLHLAATLSDRTVDVQRLALRGHALSLVASGSAQRGETRGAGPVRSIRARYRIELPDLNILAPALAGSLQANGQLEGPIGLLAAQLQATSNLSIRGAPRETVEARFTARGLPSLSSATVHAEGHLGGAPLQLDAKAARGAGNILHVVVQRGEWKSAHIEGDFTADARLTNGNGTLQLRMDRLEDLAPLLGTRLAGSVAGNLTLRPMNGRPYAQVRLEARNVAAENLTANAQLTAAGPADALSLRLAAQTANPGGEPASLTSEARLDLQARELHLQYVEARYHGESLRLLSPALLSFAQGLAIRQLRLGAQRAVVSLEGRILPGPDLHATVRQVDSNLVNAFVPGLLAQGTMEADARLQGTYAEPSGLVTFTASGLHLASAEARDIAALDVKASARLMGQTARLEGQLNAGRVGHESRLTVNGGIPLGADGRLNLEVAGKLNVAVANPMLEAQGQRAEGALAVNAAVSGTPRAPRITGTFDLTNGDLRDYAEGLHLADITAHAVAREGALEITSLTARAAPGQISMQGTIGVLQPQIPLDIRLTARDAQPVASDLLTANLSADLHVTGTLRQRVELGGTIDVKRAVVGIPDGLPPEVVVLDVRRPGEAPAAPPERPLVVGMDLTVRAPRAILVQGRGLDAELGGDVHITGTTAAPVIDGGFDLVRGTFQLASTTLTFTKGRVSFNGVGLKHGIDPTLDFTAQAQVTDTTTTLHITGLADSPQFELSSVPQLPQDEMLARLLFGQSVGRLTPLQIAEIGPALATLSGVGGGAGGFNPIARVQKAIGLDRLSFSGGTNGNTNTAGPSSTGTTVQAGRYFSNRVYVGARESTTGLSQVEVDVDLTNRLKLQTRIGNGSTNTQGTTPENDPGSSIGFTYQIEY